MTKRLLPFAAAVLAAACVTLDDPTVQRAAIGRDQRTVLLAFAAPGPLVVEIDSKAESAAKVVPGLALVVQSAQDERDLDNSRELQQYLPRWDAAEAVLAPALEKLPQTPHPGKWLTAEQAALSTGTLKTLNASGNLLEWRRKYYDPAPKHGRDYGKLLALDDALIFELNVAPGVLSDGEGNATPALWAVAKLYRAQTMRQLWRKEESVEDPAAKQLLYDFKVSPQRLVASWRGLAPQLAEKVAAAYATALAGPARGPGGAIGVAPGAPAGAAPGQPAPPPPLQLTPGGSPLPQ